MADFFARMRAVSDRLNARFSNGAITLVRETYGEPNPFEPGATIYPSFTTESLSGRVTGVPRKWVDGKTIMATDLMFAGSIPAMAPSLADRLVIDHTSLSFAADRIVTDGRILSIVSLDPLFGAGEAVMAKFVVRG